MGAKVRITFPTVGVRAPSEPSSPDRRRDLAGRTCYSHGRTGGVARLRATGCRRLDHDLEHLAGRSGEAEGVPGQDQVAGGRDREELGQALDEAQDRGVEESRAVGQRPPRGSRARAGEPQSRDVRWRPRHRLLARPS
jgi:hypothetical protein